jgi:hypothetical protein
MGRKADAADTMADFQWVPIHGIVIMIIVQVSAAMGAWTGCNRVAWPASRVTLPLLTNKRKTIELYRRVEGSCVVDACIIA